MNTKELAEIMLCVKRDHPQISWLKEEYSYESTSSGSWGYLHFGYTKNPMQIEREIQIVEESAASFLSGISADLSDFDKALILHDRLCEHLSYSRDTENRDSLIGAIYEGQASCQGYAKAYQYLLNLVGIKSLIVYGIADGPHAWNIVQLENDYVNVDTTWDDAQLSDGTMFLSHDYLFVDGKSFSATHTPYQDQQNYSLPVTSSTDWNYFVFTQTQALSTDPVTLEAEVKAAFDRALANRYSAVQFSIYPPELAQSFFTEPEGFKRADRLSEAEAERRCLKVTGRHFNKKTGVMTYFIKDTSV